MSQRRNRSNPSLHVFSLLLMVAEVLLKPQVTDKGFLFLAAETCCVRKRSVSELNQWQPAISRESLTERDQAEFIITIFY